MMKAALANNPSICKPFHYPKKKSSQAPLLIWLSSIILVICFVTARANELFQYYKCFFGIAFQLTLDYLKSCQNRQWKTIAPSVLSTGEPLLPQDLD